MRHRSCALAFAVTCTLASAAAAQYLPPPINGREEPYALDSGSLDNPTGQPVTVFQDTIAVDPQVPWVRILFSETNLPAGSSVALTSLTDGSSQTLDAEGLAQWGAGSAYFNGPSVSIELVAGPHTSGNRVAMTDIFVGDYTWVNGEAICGAADDRVPSGNKSVGRLLTAGLGGGCTGFITDLPAGFANKCHVSAGHCFVSGTKFSQVSAVIQFDVPNSSSNCTLQHPGADKQFPIKSFTAVNGGVGNDWAVFEVHSNTTTGKTTFLEQGSAIPVAGSVPGAGTTVTVTGYGVDGNALGAGSGGCSCGGFTGTGTLNQTQQTHSGMIASTPGTQINHQADTCGGSSGSPILASGEAVGVHSHAGCTSSPASSNAGTQITLAALQNALAACASRPVPATGSGGLALLGAALLVLGSAALGLTVRRLAAQRR